MLARVGLVAEVRAYSAHWSRWARQRLGRGYRVVIKLTFYLEAARLDEVCGRPRRTPERKEKERPRCETAPKQRGKKLRTIILRQTWAARDRPSCLWSMFDNDSTKHPPLWVPFSVVRVPLSLPPQFSRAYRALASSRNYA